MHKNRRFLSKFSIYLIALFTLFTLCMPFSYAFFEGIPDRDSYRSDDFSANLDNISGYSETTSEALTSSIYPVYKASDEPIVVRGASSKYFPSFDVADIPFYELENQGFSDVYKIISDILQGNSLYSMFINVFSNTSCRIYVCEYGTLGTVTKKSSSTATATNYRWFYGIVANQDKLDEYSPKFYALTYDSQNFSNYTSNTISTSTFGYNFGGVWISTGMAVFNLFSSTSMEPGRDWYFWGANTYNLKNTNYNNGNVSWIANSGSYPQYTFHIKCYGYVFGQASMADNSKVTGAYYNSTVYNYNDLNMQNIQEYDENFFASIDLALTRFQANTNDFNNLMRNNLHTLSTYVETFFNVYDLVIPSSLTIFLVALIIIIVAKGVLK